MLSATNSCSVVGGLHCSTVLIQRKDEAEIRVREASALFRDCPALRHCSQNSLATRAHVSNPCSLRTHTQHPQYHSHKQHYESCCQSHGLDGICNEEQTTHSTKPARGDAHLPIMATTVDKVRCSATPRSAHALTRCRTDQANRG